MKVDAAGAITWIEDAATAVIEATPVVVATEAPKQYYPAEKLHHALPQ